MSNYKLGSGNYKSRYVNVKRQLADKIVNNSSTFVDSDLISPSLKVGKSYIIDFYVYTICASNADVKFLLTVDGLVASDSGWSLDLNTLFNIAITSQIEIVSTGIDQISLLRCVVYNVTTSGLITLQFAQNTPQVSDCKLRIGSFMKVTEI